MRRKNLLTQVLVANLLLMVAAVVVDGVAGNPELDLGSAARGWRWSSGSRSR